MTVVIPTFNGAERVPAVLECLKSQAVTDAIQWEVLVVDNNCQDKTVEVIQTYRQSWPATVRLRCVSEPKQGLAHARQCGVENARGALVGFLDDDNLPAPNWVSAAWQFACNYPQAGAYGSQIEGKFESPPPASLKPVLFYLAVNQRGSQPVQYHPRSNGVPPGAGLVVRRQVWLDHVPPVLFLVGRVDGSMLAGEDAEALLHLHRAGWQIWYNPEMKIQHCIPTARVTAAYLQANLYGIGLCRYHLRMLALPGWQRPFMSCAYLLSDLRRVVAHYWKNRDSLQTDAAAACEMKRLMGTLLSPFYLMRLRMLSGQ